MRSYRTLLQVQQEEAQHRRAELQCREAPEWHTAMEKQSCKGKRGCEATKESGYGGHKRVHSYGTAWDAGLGTRGAKAQPRGTGSLQAGTARLGSEGQQGQGRGRGSGARRRARAAHLRGGAAAAHGVRGSLPCRCPLGARRRRRASAGHPLAATVCPRRAAAENRRGTAGPCQASAAAALAPPRRPLILPPQRRRPRLRRRGGACVWVWPPGAGPGTAARGAPAQPHRSASTPPRAARREWFPVSQWLLPRCQGDGIAGGRRLGQPRPCSGALRPCCRRSGAGRCQTCLPLFPPGGGGAAQCGQRGAGLSGEGVWWSGWFLSGWCSLKGRRRLLVWPWSTRTCRHEKRLEVPPLAGRRCLRHPQPSWPVPYTAFGAVYTILQTSSYHWCNLHPITWNCGLERPQEMWICPLDLQPNCRIFAACFGKLFGLPRDTNAGVILLKWTPV